MVLKNMVLKKHGANKHGLKKNMVLKKPICEQFGIDFQSCFYQAKYDWGILIFLFDDYPPRL